MTFTGLQNEATQQARDALKPLYKEVLASYSQAYTETMKQLETMYAKILSGVKPEDYYNTMIQYDRLNKLLKSIQDEFVKYSIKAGNTTLKASQTALSEAFYRQRYALSWVTPDIGINLDFARLDENIAIVATTGNVQQFSSLPARKRAYLIAKYGSIDNYVPKSGTLTAILLENRKSDILKIQRTITSGLIQGKSYSRMASDLKEVFGKQTADKITGAKARALRVVRTESNRNLNAGVFAQTQEARSQGVKIKRVLRASLDDRTRQQSGEMDGQVEDKDGLFHYPNGSKASIPGNSGNPAYDINDREYVIDIVDGVSPSLRRGKNPVTGEYEILNMVNYPEWAKKNGL